MTTIDAPQLRAVTGGMAYKYALDRRQWSAKTCFDHAGRVAGDYRLSLHKTRDPREREFQRADGTHAGSAYMSGGCHIYVKKP